MPRHSRSPRSFARLASAALAAAVLTFGGLLIASPASAHDELIGSDPMPGQEMPASPAQLTLTFSGNISDAEGASVVEVSDASGAIPVSDLVTTDNVLIVVLDGTASGAVTVLWKVVSSDGHPISGEFDFTVAGAPTASPTPTPSPTETAIAPVETTTPTPTAAPEPEDSTFSSAWPWVIGGLVVVGAMGAVVFLLVTRAREQKALAEARAKALSGGTEPPAEQ
ncbi:copper resistance protein CopC [Microbacterium aoyamense]|uniref:Copper resistance protein CopC n=1 Tax=Microbacterium aoyamense TaxID=344166 RepID=A0ABP5B5Z0_9MICO|nr:copper resistance CopC family protein [Microbacterium aoyamense]